MKLAIVCGLGRSGTSLIGALLNKSPQVEVFNEVPSLSEFPALLLLIRDYRRWCQAMTENPHERWRGISGLYVGEGLGKIFCGLLRAVKPTLPEGSTRWDTVPKLAPELICLKKPEAELSSVRYEDVFPEFDVKYVYCIRDPTDVYRSHLSVAWGADIEATNFLCKLEESVLKIENLAAVGRQSRVFPLDVDLMSRDFQARIAIARSLFQFLEVDMSDSVLSFLDEWPPVNRSQATTSGKKFIDDKSQVQRLEEFKAMLSKKPELLASLGELRFDSPRRTENSW